MVCALCIISVSNWINYNNVKLGKLPGRIELFPSLVPGITQSDQGLDVSVYLDWNGLQP